MPNSDAKSLKENSGAKGLGDILDVPELSQENS
jgi:hypothetical protein